jgi:glycerol uptake facilitator-like aquaporin
MFVGCTFTTPEHKLSKKYKRMSSKTTKYPMFAVILQSHLICGDAFSKKVNVRPNFLRNMELSLCRVVLCGGGTTAPALNPARYLSPRIMHFFVPIPGKGFSEWWYSWVPVVALCLGAVLGALFARSMADMLKSGLVF